MGTDTNYETRTRELNFERGKTWGVRYMVDILLIGVRGFDGGWKELSEFKIVGKCPGQCYSSEISLS